MQNGIIRFTLFGFPVTIEPWFWLIGVVFGLGYFGGAQGREMIVSFLIWMVIWVVSILVHELGHAHFQKKFGGHGTRIHLHGMGGYAASSGHFTRTQSLIISAAGPGIQLIAALIAWLILREINPENLPRFVLQFLAIFAFINIFWALLNLVPVLPLDGGRIVQHLTGSELTAAKVGTVAGVVAAIGSFMLFKLLFAPLFFGYLAYQNYQRTKSHYGGSGPVGF